MKGKAIRPLTEQQKLLVESNMHLIGFCLRRMGGIASGDAASSYEDLWQIGAMGLMEAARNYQPGKAAFSTFACHCIRQKVMIMYVKAMCRQKRVANVYAVRLDAPLVQDDQHATTYADMLPAPDDTEAEALLAAMG